MVEITQVALNSWFLIRPEQLLDANKEIPITDEGYIPLLVFDKPLTFVQPKLEVIGSGVVKMALDEPFGFTKNSRGANKIIMSQKTDGILLAPGNSIPNEPHHWLANLETEKPLSPQDLTLFSEGMAFYATKVHKALGAQASVASV